MKQDPDAGAVVDGSHREPRRARLPGFLVDEEIGLGDVLKRVTTTVGLRPCGGCIQRAAALNQRFVFSNRRRKG